MYLNKHCNFYCNKSKTIHGNMLVQIIIYLSIIKGLCAFLHIDYFFIALLDDFKLIINICHCLCPSFYPYMSNR